MGGCSEVEAGSGRDIARASVMAAVERGRGMSVADGRALQAEEPDAPLWALSCHVHSSHCVVTIMAGDVAYRAADILRGRQTARHRQTRHIGP